MGPEIILYMAIAFGFYMAWSIGANDAANAMGTSVGSKAISFKEAVIIAAIFEFSGAYIAGASVTDTMRRKIVDPMLFNDPLLVGTAEGSTMFMLGMLAALIAAALWLHVTATLGWPVSTTHSIVGAITGFGLVSVGASHIQWGMLGVIASSWVVSPVMGGILAFVIFTLIRKLIFDAPDPVASVKKWAPFLMFPVFVVLNLVLFEKGLANVDIASVGIYGVRMILLACAIAVVICVGVAVLMRRMSPVEAPGSAAKFGKVEQVFRYLQIVTACFVAFAHGSNDVANSIGPLAAIVGTMDAGTIVEKVPVPTWVLLLGAIGIVVGLATYGYKVIETIGTKITEITPSRGFAAEFGAATTILFGSHLGLPISTTHTVVGAVIGVGFARGINALNIKVIWRIVQSWLYTIPVAAGLTIVLFYILKAIFM